MKFLCKWIYDQICEYNLFASETDGNSEPEISAAKIEREKYATWLYVLLVLVSLYVIFYIALLQSNPQMITIVDISPSSFRKLRVQQPETLSCRCSNSTIHYSTFISNEINFHPICSSIFVTERWIRAFYVLVVYHDHDENFDTAAYSQLRLLASLCILSREVVLQSQRDFDNRELITIELHTEDQLESKINTTIEHFKNTLRTNLRATLSIPSIEQNDSIIYGSWRLFRPSDQLLSSKSHFSCAYINGFTCDRLFSYQNPFKPIGPIKGFVRGCLTFEAFLKNTLDCFYDIDCLESLATSFPVPEEIRLNLTKYILPKQEQNSSVHDHLLNLFVEKWSTNIHYLDYFKTCAPSFCTYTIPRETNFFSALTLLISLYGGLTIICRTSAPYLITIAVKLRKQPFSRRRINFASIIRQTHHSVRWLKQLNLFQKNSTQQEIVNTRVYLLLLAGSLLIIILFTSLSTEMIVKTVPSPTLKEYKHLQNSYSSSLKCPCSTILVPYGTMIELSANLHPICSSDYISDFWISILKLAVIPQAPMDWRNYASSEFQLLSDSCKLANKTIADTMSHFKMQSFIASYVLSEYDLAKQLNVTLAEFFHSTVVSFSELIETVRLLIQTDQPFAKLGSGDLEAFPLDLNVTTITNQITGRLSFEIQFMLARVIDDDTDSVKCICAMNKHCHTSFALYDVKYINANEYNYTNIYTLPGMVKACFVIESVFLSTLECFYMSSSCFPLLMKYIREKYEQNALNPAWIDIQPLVYREESSRFPPKMPISFVMKEMMIEKWNPTVFYENFYEKCAPIYCTYMITIRTMTITKILTLLIYTISGITSTLYLLTPLLVKSVFFLKRWKICKQRQRQTVTRLKLSDKVKTIFKMLFKHLDELNIFSSRDFASQIDRSTATQLGRWTTRVYICLLIFGLAIFAAYSAVKPRTLVKTFDKPLFETYKHLKNMHGKKLECTCSSIASAYKQYVIIKPIFHSICSSKFISEQWRMNLTKNLVADLSVYDFKDYRRFLSAHLQFLQGLCELSVTSVRAYISRFLDLYLITPHLLSENDLQILLDSSIEHGKTNAPGKIIQLLFLIRTMNHGNGIMTTYGTNYQYFPAAEDAHGLPQAISSRGVIHDNQCDCGVYYNCTSEARFIQNNTSKTVSIKGLKIGCAPSESFLASTLECFYDLSCTKLIGGYMNYSISPLKNRIQVYLNATVNELMRKSFVEEWNQSITYSSYYHQCAPAICSYTYTQKLFSWYTLTLLMGLQGGLSIVLKWITPKLVQITLKIYYYRKKQGNIIQPVPVVELNRNSNPTLPSTSHDLCIAILRWIFAMSFVIIALAIFSIVFIQHRRHQLATTRTSISLSTPTVTVNQTTIKNSVKTCQLQFNVKSIYQLTTRQMSQPRFIVTDFNNDRQADILIRCALLEADVILIANGDGTFTAQTVFPQQAHYFDVAIGDFNNDQHADVAFANDYSGVNVWLEWNKSASQLPIKTLTNTHNRLESLTIGDFDRDGYSDIAGLAISGHRIMILFGCGNGSFIQTQNSIVYEGGMLQPESVIAIDFNKDANLDIISLGKSTFQIVIWFGYGNGVFHEKKVLYTTHASFLPISLHVGDFNNDDRLDFLVSYHGKTFVTLMFGFDNHNVNKNVEFSIGVGTVIHPFVFETSARSYIIVDDFNQDNSLDFIAHNRRIHSVNILFGDSHGNFQRKQISLDDIPHAQGYYYGAVADFNSDRYKDLVTFNWDNDTVEIFYNTGEC
ncbi:unnamed protein product [Adineta ricciae]|uniref:Uncharacterized protein n=1 Tax=Adineta ricciae TaxID=249248 RepID=A0A815EP65_ADIRI|nr:unnamed protein product [Adineta ricciae]